MAIIAKKAQSGSTPSAFPDRFHSSVWLFIDGLAVVALAIVGGAFLYFYPEARERLWQNLGYGWAPVALWAATALIFLRYGPALLPHYWRRWAVAGAAVALSLAALSYVYPSRGLLEHVSLAGRWGMETGGPSLLPWGLAKMAGILAFVPLVLYPRAIGPLYFRGLSRAWRWFQLAAGYAYLGVRRLNDRMARGRKAMMEARSRASAKRAKAKAETPQPAPERNSEPETEGYAKITISDIIGRHRVADEKEDRLPPWMPAPETLPDGNAGPGWKLPSLELLAPPESLGASEEEFQDMAKQVEQALADHGVRVEVTSIKAGPRVVQFGLSPGWVAKRGDGEEGAQRSRVKVQSIITREKDLALALMTPYLRVEAPVPGAALVGLEVPVPTPTKVHLRAVIETAEFRKLAGKKGLPIAMGQDTGGAPVALDLASLPHMLIAGSTGSGKSVMINSIIASFILTKTPDQLRLLMVDPKRVELTPFNGIPHLIQPVIVEAEEVTESLRGLIREMVSRYKKMEELGVRNIGVYNERADEKMPLLVLIVDELADLMMVSGFEVEQNLVRLAQLGRAAGIHLLLATQRPSVQVVTGLLKANIPARCAFAVSGQVDSRVILDSVGAEKLMGKGDGLILHKESIKPERMQGALVYDEEIEELVKFWKEQEGPPVPVINLVSGEDDEDGGGNVDVEQMDLARDLAVRIPNLSTSAIQRRLKVGGERAGEILETLEEEGYLAAR